MSVTTMMCAWRAGICTIAIIARRTSVMWFGSSALFAPTLTCAWSASLLVWSCCLIATTMHTAWWTTYPSLCMSLTGGVRCPAPLVVSLDASIAVHVDMFVKQTTNSDQCLVYFFKHHMCKYNFTLVAYPKFCRTCSKLYSKCHLEEGSHGCSCVILIGRYLHMQTCALALSNRLGSAANMQIGMPAACDGPQQMAAAVRLCEEGLWPDGAL